MTSKEEISFMQGILLNNGRLNESESLTLAHASWLNRYVDLGFWMFGLTIQGGWLTDAGKDFFIEELWEAEGPNISTRLQIQVAHLTRCLEFAKSRLKIHQDNLSIGQIENMEAKWPDSAVAATGT